ncbi:MAG: bifunctional salicylyl-CoA 5-hydroxylase/oxidoreductase [Rhizobiales bacterium]|nr:bifunctional salicylyl-CoA 5-hydroxylase/oxidoreductase [Hyphomicrobiales bacterium]
MRIVCIGGGPAGLYFALLMKKLHPAHHITVVERNRPYDTFGWGVVFSDATMVAMRAWDPESAAEIEDAFNHWDDIEVLFKGTRQRTTGHGFVGIGRKKLLNILQRRCEALGVELVFETDVDSDLDYPDADLIIASDGFNSKIRNRYPDVFQPDLVVRPNRYIWLGTHKLFDAFTFDFRKTQHGWFQAHIYKFDDQTSTFIVETTEEAYEKHGLGEMDQQTSIDFCQDLFSEVLEGAELMTNARHLRGSAWLNFNRLICGKWSHFNGQSHVVLMGDAAHTAHFAIGSGTKLAIDDAIELTRQFQVHGHTRDKIPAVLETYEDIRRVDVARIQNAARNAMEWFEVVGERYADTLEPEQFMYSMLTRSQRISHENLRLRDKAWLEGFERWFAEHSGLKNGDGRPLPPMFTPFTARGVTLANRIVVSPMAMYSATDGLIGDFHMVHLGARAMGGAGLVFAEMTCISPDARITPGCLGLWNDEQAAAWRRVVDFVHGNSHARVGIQIGHAGRKGATKLAWDGIDQPLEEGGWPLISASAIPYLKNSQVPKAMDRADMDRVLADHVRAAELAATTGADWLELHCAHGYLLSSFLSPLTNHRIDDYGGSHENRARFPLEVFKAVRAVWPQDKPISVRLSCHDWVEGAGNTPDDAAIFAKMFKEAGADLIDCSSGQVSKEEKPVYGRLFQTPFSDKIRNEVGIPTIAVGAISEADHANSIISAGRADLCAIARPHLADPSWILHEAAKIGLTNIAWPKQYQSAKYQFETNLARAATATPAK